jgi:hypothetical protein
VIAATLPRDRDTLVSHIAGQLVSDGRSVLARDWCGLDLVLRDGPSIVGVIVRPDAATPQRRRLAALAARRVLQEWAWEHDIAAGTALRVQVILPSVQRVGESSI